MIDWIAIPSNKWPYKQMQENKILMNDSGNLIATEEKDAVSAGTYWFIKTRPKA